MRQKLGIILLSGLTLVSLSACGLFQKEVTAPNKDAEKVMTKASKKTDTKKTEKATSAKTDNSQTEEELQTSGQNEGEKSSSKASNHNGSYYSVQGKYGEVIIVNKKHPLAPNYNPGEDYTASQAFHQLLADMQSLGYDVSNQYSGFRSYDTQANLYQNYVNQDSQANADRYSARPGYSEHQTGLAYDLIDNSGQLLTEPSATKWLAENAHHYGFIVRYLPDKESVTGYMAESWHVRYIGEEAEDIYQSGLTLEEYFGVAGGDYPN